MRGRRGVSVGPAWAAIAGPALLVLAGCELTEVELVQPEDLVVAEVHVVLAMDPGYSGDPGDPSNPPTVRMNASALLHKLHGLRPGTLGGSSVQITGGSGRVVTLRQAGLHECLVASRGYIIQYLDEGSCYRAPDGTAPFSPGEELSLEVRTNEGHVLTGAGRVPGAFDFAALSTSAQGACRLEPDTNYRLGWTPADDVWSYLAEAEFAGLREPLLAREINAPDTLNLIGLTIGREDTEIVFPRHFGLLDLFGEGGDIQEDVILALQDGLPMNTRASVSISAIDRNWANWARGGDFHPSGEVRVSSVSGDGTGVFGAAVRRQVEVVAGEGDGDGAEPQPPACGLEGA